MYSKEIETINKYISEKYEEMKLQLLGNTGLEISGINLRKMEFDFIESEDKTENADVIYVELEVEGLDEETEFNYQTYYWNNPYEETVLSVFYWPEDTEAFINQEEGLIVERYPFDEQETKEPRFIIGKFLEDIKLAEYIEENGLRREIKSSYIENKEKLLYSFIEHFPYIEKLKYNGYSDVEVFHRNGAVFAHDYEDFKYQLELVAAKKKQCN